MGTSPADTPESALNAPQPDRPTRARQWKRSAGVVAAVALLVVGPARHTGASTSARPVAAPLSASDQPASDQPASDHPTSERLSRFSTLSSGTYAWHVASSPATPTTDRDQDGLHGPLHGEFPVVAVDGTVQTRRWQWGRVVTVADGWFTVASEDGYRNEYVLNTGVDAGAVTVGEQVTVVGVVDAAKPPATDAVSA